MNKFYAIDLFAGAGGLSVGLKKAGFEVVLANEIENSFCKTYAANHPKAKILEGDINSFDFNEELKKLGFVGKIHLIAGGPPCQGFSTIGKKEESDPRNNLFLSFINVIAKIKPDFVLFENVSGFKKLYGGKAFSCLCEELAQLNYEYEYAALDAVNFGLPQYRKRTIVVARKKGFNFNMPTGKHSDDRMRRTLRDAISDLPQINNGEAAFNYEIGPLNEYQKEMRCGSEKLTEHESPKHGESLSNVIRKVPYGGSILDVSEELRPKGYFKNTYARLVWEEPAPTITRNFGTPSSSRCIHPLCHRGLTTREGARLQGFPDNYIFIGSKTSKNLQIGNAVPPPLAEEIGKKIFKSLIERYG